MNFKSDNVTGAAPEILAALTRANTGTLPSYGEDEITKRVGEKLKDIFETDLAAFPVATGSAANSLALAELTPPWGAVYCHPLSHIHTDECGAPEFFTHGAKLAPIDGPAGKFSAGTLAATLKGAGTGVVHHVQPAAVSVSQVTEAGTIYSLDELKAIAAVAHGAGLAVHMDGARFANALVALGCRPADMTWRAGIDVLSFGATKNGALAAEAVIFFDKKRAANFAFRRKRGGHLFSKMRFLSAQLDAYLDGDLWLKNARHANAMAAILADGLARLPGVGMTYPAQANEVFPSLPEPMIRGLEAAGFGFYRWSGQTVRLVTAYNTAEADARAFVAKAAELARAAAAD
jgi:threonine aldolase